MSKMGVMLFCVATVNVNCQAAAVKIYTVFGRTNLQLMYGVSGSERFRGQSAENVVILVFATMHLYFKTRLRKC